MKRAILLLLIVAAPANAHDFWLQPETFFPAKGESVSVRLFVGDGFVRETERAFERSGTPRLQLVSAGRSTDLLPLGRPGKKPFLELTIKEPGQHWLAVERERRTIRLEAAKFNEYLAEEGLDNILDQRRLAKEDQKPGRERYSRYLKCLLLVGESDGGWKKTCGHRLEIVPLADPHALKAGDTLQVRVLFEGKPLARVPLFALNRDGEKLDRQRLTTAADGTATVKLSRPGVWLLRMVHMRRCADPTEADWESFWTSLSLALR